MKNETKLKKVIVFLEENNVKYRQHKNVWFGHSDVFLPDTRVAIKIDGEDRKRFYETHKGKCYPVFIRDDESLKFILEKLQNTIVKSMMKEQKTLMREWKKEENRRINAEQMKLRAERKAAKEAMEARKAAKRGGRR
jgi:hypothetical protein|nr:MAG TPA: DNA mismatch endonuclease [Caudoviricetes sp.]